jgi:hypothetical protein
VAGSASPLQEAVDRVVGKKPTWDPLNPAQAKGAKPGGTSVGRPSATQSGVGGSAFNESDATQREYYAARILPSSDGIFQLSWQPIKSILLTGGTRATFKDPPA